MTIIGSGTRFGGRSGDCTRHSLSEHHAHDLTCCPVYITSPPPIGSDNFLSFSWGASATRGDPPVGCHTREMPCAKR